VFNVTGVDPPSCGDTNRLLSTEDPIGMQTHLFLFPPRGYGLLADFSTASGGQGTGPGLPAF
jgi:hypothetical protein